MKVTIRDFLWISLSIGIGLGWFLDHRRLSRLDPYLWQFRADVAKSALEEDGYVVEWVGRGALMEHTGKGMEVLYEME